MATATPNGRPRNGWTVACGICAAPVYCRPSRIRQFCSKACYGKAKIVNPEHCSVGDCKQRVLAKAMCSKHYGRAEKYGDPNKVTMRKRGTGGYTTAGYLIIGRDGRQRMEHVLIAEAALGKPLPPGSVVHHGNGNPSDNRPDNLVICPGEWYHRLIHRRMRALAECGYADWRDRKSTRLNSSHSSPSRMPSSA